MFKLLGLLIGLVWAANQFEFIPTQAISNFYLDWQQRLTRSEQTDEVAFHLPSTNPVKTEQTAIPSPTEPKIDIPVSAVPERQEQEQEPKEQNTQALPLPLPQSKDFLFFKPFSSEIAAKNIAKTLSKIVNLSITPVHTTKGYVLRVPYHSERELQQIKQSLQNTIGEGVLQ